MRNSRIILVKNIKIDRNYTNVLSYTEEEMLNLCEAQKIAEREDYSFIRKSGSIHTNFTYEECIKANYIAFQNKDYSNKWFFAWIDDVTYISDATTDITFSIDAWSTWFSYWTKKDCFIKRQHVLDDAMYKHTIPENLDVGEVIEEAEITDSSYTNEYGYYVAVSSSWKIKDNSTGSELLESDKGEQYAGISVYDNNVFGTQILLIKIDTLEDFKNLVLLLSRTNSDGHIADIENIFIVPNALIEASKLIKHDAVLYNNEKAFTFYTLQYDLTPTKFTQSIQKLQSFSTYKPKNNKCFCYPYNYMFVSNNQGSHNIYKYEDFSSDTCQFENQISLTIGCSGRLVPLNYKHMQTADDEALALGKYPTCSWSSDAYTNWLTKEAVNNVTSLALGVGSLVAGAMTGGVSTLSQEAISQMTIKEQERYARAQKIDSVSSGASLGQSVSGSVLSTIGNFYSASLMPNIEGGQATGDIIWSTNNNKFVIRQMRAKDEYMKIIDDYFSRFGYKSNRIESPNITGRKEFNYVEIGDAEEIGYGEVPSKYMEVINNACRRGITIWHNYSNLGNYNIDNSIV